MGILRTESICPVEIDKFILVANWIGTDIEIVNYPMSKMNRINKDIGVWKIKQLKK